MKLDKTSLFLWSVQRKQVIGAVGLGIDRQTKSGIYCRRIIGKEGGRFMGMSLEG